MQSVAGQVRVMKCAIEARIGEDIPQDAPMWGWIVEHAAELLTSFEVGKDGRTAYERLRGKRSKREIVEF